MTPYNSIPRNVHAMLATRRRKNRDEPHTVYHGFAGRSPAGTELLLTQRALQLTQ